MIELKEGEYICKKCKGKKFIYKTYKFHMNNEPIQTGGRKVSCKECNGTGKIDWVQNIVGKRDEMSLGFFPDDIGLGYLSDPDNEYLREE
jgi:hypothetical protein